MFVSLAHRDEDGSLDGDFTDEEEVAVEDDALTDEERRFLEQFQRYPNHSPLREAKAARGQTYSILGLDSILKEAWEPDLQQNPSCTHVLGRTPRLVLGQSHSLAAS